MAEMNFHEIEKKWQKRWEDKKIFEANIDKGKKKFYVLEMFPYPSANGLHMGHAFNYTIGDIYARFKRMQGLNLLYPMGYDSLGLPAENAAIKAGIKPKEYTERAIDNFIRQQKMLGLSYDWSRIIKTHSPEYYKWDQWIFLKMLEKGIAFKKKASVNWCPKCESVLANEQVHNGKCWRHNDTNVEIKDLEQWFFRITDYANELYEKIDSLSGWPERVKSMQRNWIGKSYGSEIDFEIPTKLNFVLLHGYTGSPEANFFPWLKKELENRGYKVNVPKLPNSDNPSINEQIEYVLKNCKFDENTVLLGHSLGSVVALKVLEKLDKPIKKLILTSGFVIPNTKDKPYVKTFDWNFDFNKIRGNFDKFCILKDINDKEIRAKSADNLKAALGGEIISFEAEEEHICGKEEPVVLDNCLEKWPIFTTRADTLFGVTFMVVSAQHPRLNELIIKNQKKAVEEFLKKIKSTKQEDMDKLDKDGVFTGSYAVNPMTNEKIPIWAGNFVVADYGSGMVMAVPAHDQRDFDFAKKYKILVKQVIIPKGKKYDKNIKEAYTGNGVLINSQKFDGFDSEEAKEKIIKELEKKKSGRKKIQYKLRDWLISRQRYWGTPIPIIYCGKCGVVPVPEKDLPVELPEKVEFGKGNPLSTNKEFVNVKCSRCRGNAKRETDTMDTFVNSSWYFLRYCDPKNNKNIFEKENAKYWMPIDQYIGGAEHACMHLIYFRFYTKFLRDMGLISFDEPALKLFNQGMLHGNDGMVMSKSRGNVVMPEEVSEKYGIDTARIFLISIASPDKDIDWSDSGIEGSLKFTKKVSEIIPKIKVGKSSARLESKINKTIKEITEEISEFRYNLAIIKLRQMFELIEQEKESSKKDLESFIKMLSVFAPHISEELWEKIKGKGFVSLAEWPRADEKKIDIKIEQAEQASEKTIDDILNILKIIKERSGKDAEKIYLYAIPNELANYNEKEIEKRTGKKVKVFAVNNKDKHDPENKAGKAKPGRPAIYVE